MGVEVHVISRAEQINNKCCRYLRKMRDQTHYSSSVSRPITVSDFSRTNALRMLALILISSNFVDASVRLLRIDARLPVRKTRQNAHRSTHTQETGTPTYR
jgi:hypothetical protein